MAKKHIVAKSHGKIAGEADVEWPNDLKEAIKMDGEAEVFNLYSQAKLIKERAKLYPKTPSAGSMSKKSVYEKMLAAGVDAATATQVSGYSPEQPA